MQLNNMFLMENQTEMSGIFALRNDQLSMQGTALSPLPLNTCHLEQMH